MGGYVSGRGGYTLWRSPKHVRAMEHHYNRPCLEYQKLSYFISVTDPEARWHKPENKICAPSDAIFLINDLFTLPGAT